MIIPFPTKWKNKPVMFQSPATRSIQSPLVTINPLLYHHYITTNQIFITINHYYGLITNNTISSNYGLSISPITMVYGIYNYGYWGYDQFDLIHFRSKATQGIEGLHESSRNRGTCMALPGTHDYMTWRVCHMLAY